MESARTESLFAQAVDEFTDRLNRGDRPDPADFLARYPAAADLLRDVLPALLAVRSTDGTADTDPSPGPAAPPRETVGGYVLVRELGRGGMGVVYLAVHPALKRAAAVKMVKADRADPKELIRFLAEAEAVAAVEHPHVVRVYEYGDDAGRPFLALEYLSGGNLADRLAGGGRQSAVDAAGLVAKLARGVAAAHAQGIVHRDLKPHNVLFDAAGEPKVTDFGLAKLASGDLTRTQAVMGTPSYMAPEQAAGGSKFVGPPADVWALGVILYECLTGDRPFPGTDPWEVMHKVQSYDPTPPRKRVPGLPRDLELICLKCLAKPTGERYPTAAELADDLERFAAGKPVSVRPAGPMERAYKVAKRNKLVAGLLAAVVVSLSAGLAAAVVFGVRADRSNDESAARLKQVETGIDALGDVFTDIDPEEGAGDDTGLRARLVDRLAKASDRLDRETVGDEIAVARLREKLGNALSNLGRPDLAIAPLARARDAVMAARGPDDPEAITASNNLALAYKNAGRADDAIPLLENCVLRLESLVGPGDADVLRIMNNLGTAYLAAGRADEAVGLYEAIRPRFRPGDPVGVLAANSLGVAYVKVGRVRDAVRLYDALRPRVAAAFPGDHPQALQIEQCAADAYQLDGRLPDAIRMYERVVDRQAKRFGSRAHPDVLLTLTSLGTAYEKAGRDREAARTYHELLVAYRRQQPPADPDVVGRVLLDLGDARLRLGLFAEAEEPLRECLAIREKTAPGSWRPFAVRSYLGAALLGQGKTAEAAGHLRAAVRGLVEKREDIPEGRRDAILNAARLRVVPLDWRAAAGVR